jgi:putative acetyltransferase
VTDKGCGTNTKSLPTTWIGPPMNAKIPDPHFSIGLARSIRPTTPADGDILVDIWQSSVDATHSFVLKADLVEIAAQVHETLPLEPLWLALDDRDRPLAFLGLSLNSLDALFVAGEYRGRGVGRSLIDFAKGRYSWLTTIVNEQNEQAVGFYEHVGFQAESRSLLDADGRPYPVLHMRWSSERAA